MPDETKLTCTLISPLTEAGLYALEVTNFQEVRLLIEAIDLPKIKSISPSIVQEGFQ